MWQEDKRWSDGLLPQVKRILGEYLIGEAAYEEDRDHNTDLIVLCIEPVRIACRIRRHGYLRRYPDQFTVRSGRPSGAKSELAKIMDGWGDYMFYGFADPEETRLVSWVLLDLLEFRRWVNLRRWKAGG